MVHVNAVASELLFDDGQENFAFKAPIGSIGACKFNISHEMKLSKLKIHMKGTSAKIHVLDSDFESIYSKAVTPLSPHPKWFVENILEVNVVVQREFYVGVEWTDPEFWLSVDSDQPHNMRSYLGRLGSPGKPKPRENYMIRAYAREPFEYDAFICHASEDKESFVRPLAKELRKKGLRVWYDEFTLKLGDSLRRSIDRGLARALCVRMSTRGRI